jgi:hypothetical protein
MFGAAGMFPRPSLKGDDNKTGGGAWFIFFGRQEERNIQQGGFLEKTKENFRLGYENKKGDLR